jgi:hypothetical protein
LLFGLLRTIKKAAVGFLGRFHRTNRASVNAGRGHTHEEDAIKTRIASAQSSIESAAFLRHASNIGGLSSSF